MAFKKRDLGSLQCRSFIVGGGCFRAEMALFCEAIRWNLAGREPPSGVSWLLFKAVFVQIFNHGVGGENLPIHCKVNPKAQGLNRAHRGADIENRVVVGKRCWLQ